MGFGLGSVLSAINPTAAIGTALTDAGASIWSTNSVNKANKEAATQAYNREVSLMAMQNAYNTPAEQMKRYVEAGLNPNLIYGQSNLSASATPQHVQKVERYNLPSALSAYVHLASLENAARELDIKNGQLNLAMTAQDHLNEYRDNLNNYQNAMLGVQRDRLSFDRRRWLQDSVKRSKEKVLLDKKIAALGQHIDLMNDPMNRVGAPWYLRLGSVLSGGPLTNAEMDEFLSIPGSK